MLKTFAAALAALALAVLSLSAQDFETYDQFSDDQLDNLLAPIALYPDPLLAQVLIAATFPDQVDDAARFVRADYDAGDIDDQPWDVSVKAVAHYPAVIQMMSDKLDWTSAVGQAYVNQSTEVMSSVQRLRAEAREAGNLVTSPEMEVVYSDGIVEIWPAQPRYIYVPQYDPGIIYVRHAPLFFGFRFIIGAWLNYDCDWHEHRVYYHGWDDRDRDHDREWIRRSRPYVRPTNIYVNIKYEKVIVNRDVIRRPVNYPQLNRYDDVHRQPHFDTVRPVRRAVQPPPSPPQALTTREPIREPVRNKIIDRNFNTSDPRLNDYRGHKAVQPPPPRAVETPAFTPSRGGFDTRVVSERGRASRSQPPPPPPQKKPEKVERKRP